jgi:hypothetical protein
MAGLRGYQFQEQAVTKDLINPNIVGLGFELNSRPASDPASCPIGSTYFLEPNFSDGNYETITGSHVTTPASIMWTNNAGSAKRLSTYVPLGYDCSFEFKCNYSTNDTKHTGLVPTLAGPHLLLGNSIGTFNAHGYYIDFGNENSTPELKIQVGYVYLGTKYEMFAGSNVPAVRGNVFEMWGKMSIAAPIGGASSVVTFDSYIKNATTSVTVSTLTNTFSTDPSRQILVDGVTGKFGVFFQASKFTYSTTYTELTKLYSVGAGLSGTCLGLGDNSLQVRTKTTTGVRADSNGLFVDFYKEIPAGTIDGSNPTFNLLYTPVVGTEQVYMNGICQESGSGNDYTISGKTITFTNPPATNTSIVAAYYVASRT